MAPTLVASRAFGGALPLARERGAVLAWGGPALRTAQVLVTTLTALPSKGAQLAWDGPALLH